MCFSIDHVSAPTEEGGGCLQVNKFEQVCSLQSLTGGGCLYREVPCRGESLYMTENITLPQLCWQAVKMCLSVRHSAFTLCPINCPNNESGSTFNGWMCWNKCKPMLRYISEKKIHCYCYIPVTSTSHVLLLLKLQYNTLIRSRKTHHILSMTNDGR